MNIALGDYGVFNNENRSLGWTICRGPSTGHVARVKVLGGSFSFSLGGIAYSVISQTALGQTTAGRIVVRDNFFAHLVAGLLVRQPARLQDRARYLETENHPRLRNSAMLAAP